MHKHDCPYALMFRVNAFVDPVAQFSFSDFAWSLEDHRGKRSLAPFFAGYTEDRDLANRGMLHDDLFDVLRENVYSTGDNQILLAIYEVKKAVLIDVAQVAAVQPTIDNSLCG